MILSSKQIKDSQILENSEDSFFTRDTYNLRIDKILTTNGEELDEFILPPQGIVVAVSREIFHMPENVIAYTTVKNALSQLGILALNIGIVDPGYSGPISSTLINFGKKSFNIKAGESFLRMTFHKLSDEPLPENITFKPQRQDKKAYIEKVKLKSVLHLASKFLNLDDVITDFQKTTIEKINKKLKKSRRKRDVLVGVFVTILGLFFTGFEFLKINETRNNVKSDFELQIARNVADSLKKIHSEDRDSILKLRLQNQILEEKSLLQKNKR